MCILYIYIYEYHIYKGYYNVVGIMLEKIDYKFQIIF